MAPASVHNAVLSQVRAWTSLLVELDPGLAPVLRRDPAVVELLAGARDRAVIRVRHARAAADLLVLLDHLNLHTGRRLFLAALGEWTYLVTDHAGADRQARGLAHRLTESPDRPQFRAWPGRIDQIALVTCDRPDTLARTLDSYLDNLRRFRRPYVEVTVYDDSGPDGRDRMRALVESRQAAGGRVRYFGPEQKRRLREVLERALAGAVPQRHPPPEVLDALLGGTDPDGGWRGSSAQQRNWATLLGAGRRVLVSDDDARPDVLDVPLDRLRVAALAALPALGGATAPVWPGELIDVGCSGDRFTSWPSDLLGRFEETEPGLVSAAYTGHPDRRTALWLERFFEVTAESVDVLGTGAPLRPVRRERPAPGYRKFRGGTYVTSGCLDGVEFAVRRDRNEDFSLALSQRLTSRLQPRELKNVHMLHQRGARHTSPFTAHLQEREGNLVNHLIATVCAQVLQAGESDPWQFCERGLALLECCEDGDTLGAQLFAEGLAYRRRALAHLARLQAMPAGWARDRSARRSRLLRAGARRLRLRRAVRGPVLTECLQVLLPDGMVSTMERKMVRRELRTMPEPVRVRAVVALEREAAYLRRRSAGAGRAEPADGFAARLDRKRELSRRLVEEIDAQLGLGASGAEQRFAEQRFAEQVCERVLADVRLFLRALPWFCALRAVRLRLGPVNQWPAPDRGGTIMT